MKKLLSLCLIFVFAFSLASCSAEIKTTESKTAESETSGIATTETNLQNVQTGFDADEYYARLESCVKQIREKTDFKPDIALVLGSGLGNYADKLDISAEIPYSEIEGFPVSTVAGHDGKLIFCEYKGKKLAVMKGRVHYYEGYDIHEVVLPLRVLHMLGADTVILTNAVGAINTDYHVGDFVLNVDHISSFVPSPLVGANLEKLGDRFVDMSKVYDSEMIEIAENAAKENDIAVHEGIMIQVTGPQYETPTEIKMYRSLGADTVGMSTVVEAIAARHMGMRTCVISCITNMAAGIQGEINHEEVQSSSDKSAKNFETLVSGLISELPLK